jgi:hypothetical protein
MVKRPQTAIVGLKVRMREPLRKLLEVAAKKRGVSLNAELVHRVNQSFVSESFKQIADQTFTHASEMEKRASELLDQSKEYDAQAQQRLADSDFILAQIKKLLKAWGADLAKYETIIMDPIEEGGRTGKDERQHHPTRKK